jgi:hypothetical protein
MPCTRLVFEESAFTGSSAEASKIIRDSECIVAVREWLIAPTFTGLLGQWSSALRVRN